MISVIVPVYNVDKYLKRCVDSIINQTYSDLEIILVDDGSTDDSGSLCDELKKTDARIKVLHKVNGGLSSARNAGLAVATGEYIGFVDSDDWIELDMYECLMNSLHKSGAEVAVTGLNRIYDNGYSKKQFVKDTVVVYSGDQIVKEYLQQNSFSTAAWDKLYKKNLFDKRRFPEGKLYEDAPVIYDILKNINRICCVGKPHYNYFQRANSICGLAFSKKKMDHYYFSHEIFVDVLNLYPHLSKVAEVFWGCKLVEIVYSIAESNNKSEFKTENKMIKKELRKVATNVLFSNTVPSIIKLKTLLSLLGMEKIYVFLKKINIKKG